MIIMYKNVSLQTTVVINTVRAHAYFVVMSDGGKFEMSSAKNKRQWQGKPWFLKISVWNENCWCCTFSLFICWIIFRNGIRRLRYWRCDEKCGKYFLHLYYKIYVITWYLILFLYTTEIQHHFNFSKSCLSLWTSNLINSVAFAKVFINTFMSIYF